MRRLIVLALLLMTSACSTLVEKPPEAPAELLWQSHYAAINGMESWGFRGRTAIVQDRDGWNANVTWRQQIEDYQIRLTGPFSQGGAVLEGHTQFVKLTLSNGENYFAETPEQLLWQVMNVQLPVSALRDWVRGIPHSLLSVDAKELDLHGRLTTLHQAGWEIEYQRYQIFGAYQLPGRIFIKNDALSVRIVISQWQDSV